MVFHRGLSPLKTECRLAPTVSSCTVRLFLSTSWMRKLALQGLRALSYYQESRAMPDLFTNAAQGLPWYSYTWQVLNEYVLNKWSILGVYWVGGSQKVGCVTMIQTQAFHFQYLISFTVLSNFIRQRWSIRLDHCSKILTPFFPWARSEVGFGHVNCFGFMLDKVYFLASGFWALSCDMLWPMRH